MNRHGNQDGHENLDSIPSAPGSPIWKFVTIGPEAFEEMFEIAKLWKS